MIVPMKKVSIITQSCHQMDMLKLLGKQGVLHIACSESLTSNSTTEIEDALDNVDKLLKLMSARIDDPKVLQSNFKIDQLKGFLETRYRLDDKKMLLKQLNKLEEEIKPWGDFDDLEIQKMKDRGVVVRYFICDSNDWNIIDTSTSIVKKLINTLDKRFYFITLSMGDESFPSLDEFEVIQPRSIKKEKALCLEEIKSLEKEWDAICLLAPRFLHMKQELEQNLKLAKAQLQLNQQEGLSIITGFCPYYCARSLEKIMIVSGNAIIIDDPLDSDSPPTIVDYGFFNKLFLPIVKFLGVVPGYRELMPTTLFLIFFGIFFAILIGDAGYGITIVLISIIFRKYHSNLLSKENFRLLIFLGVMTTIWGAVTGGWFGIKEISQSVPFNMFIIPAIYSFSDLTNDTIIHICFLIGTVQLVLAHLLLSFAIFPRLKSLSHLGWAMFMMGLLFVVEMAVFGTSLPWPTIYLLSFGFVLLILFDQVEFKKSLLAIPSNLLNMIGSFSDIISYVRLFAVGMATKYVAVAFNTICIDLGWSTPATIIGTIFIFIFGHSVNLLMGAMSVLVHGIRLNFLEFSKHLNTEWAGIEYQPFQIKESDDGHNTVG